MVFYFKKMTIKRGFASDNNSGIHPDILDALIKANSGHCIAYGDDEYTSGAIKRIREHFGDCEVYFVLTGTGANVLSIYSSSNSFNAVICAASAHIFVDECGAPEKFTGCKLLKVPALNGKITVEAIATEMHEIGFEHHVQPKIVSISQSTELGTVYTPEEIKKICNYAHSNNMYVHMDGARLANAAVFLGKDMKSISVDCGIDVLSFGGTKNGMFCAESVIFFKKGLSENFKYIRKQGMQLASKMRFISAQFEAYFEKAIWKSNAIRSNSMAKLLEDEISTIKGVKVIYPVESNAVFAKISPEIIEKLQNHFFFYIWDEENSIVRWMTSFDTTEEDIKKFTGLIKSYS